MTNWVYKDLPDFCDVDDDEDNERNPIRNDIDMSEWVYEEPPYLYGYWNAVGGFSWWLAASDYQPRHSGIRWLASRKPGETVENWRVRRQQIIAEYENE